MDECIAWSTVGKNDWMDELLSRLGRGNFDIRSRLKNRELAPDQKRGFKILTFKMHKILFLLLITDCGLFSPPGQVWLQS